MRQPAKSNNSNGNVDSYDINSSAQLRSVHNSLMQLATCTQNIYEWPMCNWLQIWIIKWRWKRETMQIKCSFIAKALLFVCASKASYYTVHYLFLCADFCSLFVFHSFRCGKKFNIWKWICHFRRSRFGHLKTEIFFSSGPHMSGSQKKNAKNRNFIAYSVLVLSLFHFINLNWKQKKGDAWQSN